MKQALNNEQWLAIKNCDKSYDGKFFYALKSTKIVCRPSCTARTPNPKNIEIFDSVEEAQRRGYRPCQRCRPDDMAWQGPKHELALGVKAYIDKNHMEKITAASLGAHFFANPFYLHRVFKNEVGATILEYQHQVRIAHAAEMAARTDYSMSYIGSAVGYSTLSHFSRTFKKIMGVSPSRYRREHHH